MRLSNLKPGKRNYDVQQVKGALFEKGFTGLDYNTGYFGRGVRHAYGRWQRSLGYRGKDANGIPGRTSLEELGFRVKR